MELSMVAEGTSRWRAWDSLGRSMGFSRYMFEKKVKAESLEPL